MCAENNDGTVIYTRDTVDNLRQVTDSDQLVTQYTYDGLNNLTRLTSPDTGITDYTHDDAGNRITQTDARTTARDMQTFARPKGLNASASR
ncbi:MAG: RHS repeat protein [Xanthomonadales bacterium]|nr:RHS repeat protein [Xanthomonadales bacterium]